MMSRALQLALWGLLMLFAISAHATEIVLTGDETSLPLAPLAAVYEDQSAALSIEEVALHGRFAPQPKLLHPGYTTSAIWLRFSFINASPQPLTRWLSLQPARLQEVSLYLQQDGRWQRSDAGVRQPFRLHPIPAANPVLPLLLAPGERLVAYVRIAGQDAVTIEPTLWEPRAFREAESRTRLVDGLMLGGLVVAPLFSLLMIFMLRERAFLLYTLMTLTFCLGEASDKGYSFMYLWPEATGWAAHNLPWFALIGTGLSILFLRELVDTRRRFPRSDRLLLLVLAIRWLPALGLLFGDYRFWAKFSAMTTPLVPLTLFFVSVLAMLKGIHAARYYTAAFVAMAGGGLLHVAILKGVIGGELGEYALPVAMLLSNILMLAAVVDRIMLVRQEKEAAQNTLIEARTMHEAELEQAVAKRTADLNAALTETRKTNRTQSRLVAYISHDLRAPLATIINYARLLSHRGDEETRRYQATIERSAMHQLELIDDLVEFARGELEHLELVPAPTYLHDWLHDIAGQAELLAVQYDNRFVLEITGDAPPVVVFDPKRLRQILINLLQNAAKFTSNGEIRLCLHATPAADGKVELSFAVEDTGPGIPQQDAERIFLPFERRKSGRAGSGLGLSIARKLARAMGSDLTLKSSPGKGSRFGFRLTVETAEEADVPHPIQAFAFPEPFGTGKTLLVADDNPASREYLREVLSTADFEIVSARDGDEAWRIAQQRRFDAVLVDQFMPGMGGWEVLQKLHEAAPSAVPPVILCSAMPPQRPEGFPSGLDFYATLLKPIGADKLLQTLQSAFDRTQQVAQPDVQPGAQQAMPQTGQQPPAEISADILAPLRDMIADGCITEIEEWAAAFAAAHPEHADFARRIGEAARQCDMGALTWLFDDANISTPEIDQPR
ncbi:MAG TPA: hybrid sensor histidine kinase/response regulator [Gallionella sp.]|nr:hybrid sensor histidine kinase/response regulator [Gallionella sp.]